MGRGARAMVFAVIFIAAASGCRGYQEDFTFKGTVQEIRADEEILVLKEYGAADGGIRDGNVYEIPAKGIGRYEIGEKLEVTVFTNTDADVWDTDNMKFEIKQARN